MNVLVVEDTPLIREIVVRTLSRRGDSVTAVADGSEALRAAETSSFDVAVVDYDIPRPNGLDVLARLRTLQPNAVRILMSGELDVGIALDAVNRGEVSRVIGKPFAANALADVIDEALDMRRRVGEQYLATATEEQQEERRHLEACLSENLLRLVVQPIVSASNREVVAYEALLRSTHPVIDGPLSVLSAAERHGHLGWVATHVVQCAATWMHRLPEGVRLFLNLHPAELADPDGLSSRMRLIEPWADRVVLEITESSPVSNADCETSMALLREMGFAIAVDDLGAGYSSLSALADIQPDYIKVDMSIVRGVDAAPRKRRLLELLCLFGGTTSSPVIAEGIETEAEAETVRAAGVSMMQGYLFGRPSDVLTGAASARFAAPCAR